MDKITSRFLRVVCDRCKYKQVIFGKSTVRVKCARCNRLLVKTSGGKAKIRACVAEIL